MRTPKEFEKNLKSGTVTQEMLGACIYSVNKRAKNYRDLKNRSYGKYRTFSWQSMKEMYDLKDRLLAFVVPCEIHKAIYANGRTQFFLYYEIGNFKAHQKIEYKDLPQYKLPQREIGEIYNPGKEASDLISLQFVRKVLAELEGGAEYDISC